MRASLLDIHDLLLADGVIAGREHPHLRTAIAHQRRLGHLVSLLPGVYASPEVSAQPLVRAAAVSHWDPNAVLTHEAAAALSFWPDIAVTTVRCQVAHQRCPQAGFAFSRGAIPPELVINRRGCRITSPELTALDLCETLGGDAIDTALRTRATTLVRMRRALELTPGRLNNQLRRTMLEDSRDEPWSKAERDLHRLFRTAGIVGWTSNKPLHLAESTIFPDVWFPRLRLVFEVDGREFHADREIFESDRWRQNDLMLEGYFVLRFTWRMITDQPDRVLAAARRAMQIQSSRLGR